MGAASRSSGADAKHTTRPSRTGSLLPPLSFFIPSHSQGSCYPPSQPSLAGPFQPLQAEPILPHASPGPYPYPSPTHHPFQAGFTPELPRAFSPVEAFYPLAQPFGQPSQPHALLPQRGPTQKTESHNQSAQMTPIPLPAVSQMINATTGHGVAVRHRAESVMGVATLQDQLAIGCAHRPHFHQTVLTLAQSRDLDLLARSQQAQNG